MENVRTYFPNQRVDVLTGVMRDKNYEVMIDSIGKVANRVFTVMPANPRALDAEEYAACFRASGVDAKGYPTVGDGLRDAVAHARACGAPLICLGSLYLYGELSEEVQKQFMR